MKATNIKQLILNFIGGGKIKFPTRFLKSVDIESPDISQGVEITPELLENEDIFKKVKNWGLTDEEIRELVIITNISEGDLNFVYDEDLQATTNFSKCVILTHTGNIPDRYDYTGVNHDNLFDYVKNLKYLLYCSINVEQDELKIKDENYNYCTVLKKEKATNTYIMFSDVSSSFAIGFDLNSKPMIYAGADNI